MSACVIALATSVGCHGSSLLYHFESSSWLLKYATWEIVYYASQAVVTEPAGFSLGSVAGSRPSTGEQGVARGDGSHERQETDRDVG